jgi:hypothetical protein
MTAMILIGLSMGLRLALRRRCSVCGQPEADDEVKAHALGAMLLGLAIDELIAKGVCPKCGSEGNDLTELREAFDEWSSSEESLEDLNDDAEDLGLNDD